MENNLQLCFINFIGKDVDENNIYEFLFTDNIEEFWGENFEYKPCCLCNQLIPQEDSYQLIKTLKTSLDLTLIQDSCCFGFTDCMDGIISLAFENIDEYEEYPDYRLVLNYGLSLEDVETKLAKKNILFENEKGEE